MGCSSCGGGKKFTPKATPVTMGATPQSNQVLPAGNNTPTVKATPIVVVNGKAN